MLLVFAVVAPAEAARLAAVESVEELDPATSISATAAIKACRPE
jgi:hypothetical protein